MTRPTVTRASITAVLLGWAAWSAIAAPAATSVIPLCAGLTIVTAVSQPDGDYESIKRVVSVDAKKIVLRYASERFVVDENEGNGMRTTNVTHEVLAEDHASAPHYLIEWVNNLPLVVPGTTSLGPSRAILENLKSRGAAEISILRDLFPEPSLDRAALGYIFNGKTTYKLVRDPKPAQVSVLVDGRPTMLPAIRATGDTFGDKVEFFFLDDPANPMALRFRLGIGAYAEVNKMMREAAGRPAYPSDDKASLQVVRISRGCAGGELPELRAPEKPAAPPEGGGGSDDAVAALESALEKKGDAVDVYDIFFSFNSATIRPESEPMLKTLTTLLTKHPDWKLSLGGHTDSIANDAYNLDLSRKRAEAAKAALIARGIAAVRLATQGFGESRPRDTNDTLEGRARNRRVELVRQ